MNLVHSSCILFADDTTLFASGSDERLLVCSLEHDLTIISDWFKANKLTLNKNKTMCMLFNSKGRMKNNPSISIDGEAIPFVNHTKFLGVWIDNKLNWKEHTERLLIKLKRNSHLLYQSKNFLTPHAKKIIYYAQIYSHLMYGLSIWGNITTRKNLKKLMYVQQNCISCTQSTDKFLTLDDMIKLENLKFSWKTVNKELPAKLHRCATTDQMELSLNKTHKYDMRNKRLPNMPVAKNKLYSSSIFCKGIKNFETLPAKLKACTDFKCFIHRCKVMFWA